MKTASWVLGLLSAALALAGWSTGNDWQFSAFLSLFSMLNGLLVTVGDRDG